MELFNSRFGRRSNARVLSDSLVELISSYKVTIHIKVICLLTNLENVFLIVSYDGDVLWVHSMTTRPPDAKQTNQSKEKYQKEIDQPATLHCRERTTQGDGKGGSKSQHRWRPEESRAKSTTHHNGDKIRFQ